jgi:hypothetical protein
MLRIIRFVAFTVALQSHAFSTHLPRAWTTLNVAALGGLSTNLGAGLLRLVVVLNLGRAIRRALWTWFAGVPAFVLIF